MPILEIENVTKRFEEVDALRGVSLQVARGQIFGLIGPDGAGKTTLMRLVCTLLQPDSGDIRVLGMSVRDQSLAIRSHLGYMPQRFSLYADLTVEQNLRFFADLFQVPAEERQAREEELFTFSRLGPFKKRKAGALSGGMKQKLALMCALIHTPPLLVLDEPTFGVDPLSRQEFWNILHELKNRGTAILVSTAYMDEADLCDQVGLIHRGELRATGTPEAIRRLFTHPLYRVTARDLRKLRTFFESEPKVHSIQLFGDALHLSFDTTPSAQDWHRWKQLTNGNLQTWQEQEPSVEDVFMELLGEKA